MSETLDDYDDISDNTTDLCNVSSNVISEIPFKLAFFMFFIGMVIFSDAFTSTVLVNIDNTLDDDLPTTKGTIIQLTIYTICLVIVDLMITYGWV